MISRTRAGFDAIAACPKPVIAAINGHALGGGCELALCCDYRLMVEDGRSRIGLTEVQLGLMPADGATQRLPRLIGLARALPMLYEGSRLSGTEAAQAGLVMAVTPAEFGTALDSLTTRLAGVAPQAFALIKDAVRRGLELPLQAGIQIERENFARACMSEDAVIGVSSFLTGKVPDFRGR
jgi:enoyl-CoA hydratase/carnithine racemase